MEDCHGHSTKEDLNTGDTRLQCLLENYQQTQRNDTHPVKNVRCNDQEMDLKVGASNLVTN